MKMLYIIEARLPHEKSSIWLETYESLEEAEENLRQMEELIGNRRVLYPLSDPKCYIHIVEETAVFQ